jgi:hypothetical protein
MLATNISTPPTSESALARLWRDSHILCPYLETADGVRYRVLHPGVQSSEAGPDFRGAVLVDQRGRRVSGDVELHRAAGDWYAHRHHLDPNYNGVVLHVVLKRAAHGSSRQASGTTAPVVEFKADAAASVGAGSRVDSIRLHGPGPDRIGAELDRLGDRRFLARSRGFVMAMKADADPDQMVYEGVMEALGYATNRKPFTRLARLVTYQALQHLRTEPTRTRAAGIEAVLLWAAGLLDNVAPEARKRQLNRMVRRMDWLPRRKLTEWKLFRVRPANHPARRISGIAAVLARTMDSDLSVNLETALLAGGAVGVRDALVELPLIGAGRAAEITMNVVLPYLNARGVVSKDPPLAQKSLDEYRLAPPMAAYGSTRRFARSMGIKTDRSVITTARRQQGLLHLQKHLASAIEAPGGLRLPAFTAG